jgi:hypothetical protein
MAKLRQQVCLSGSMQRILFSGLAKISVFLFFAAQLGQTHFMKIQMKYFQKLLTFLAVSHTPKVVQKLNINVILMSTNV